jgi:hypothetical protein
VCAVAVEGRELGGLVLTPEREGGREGGSY